MTTVLTETGWANAETGEILGEWTDNTDKVDEGDEIIVPLEVVANTLGGNDIITGTSTDDLVLGISNQGTIDTGEGKDTISGTGGDIGILTLSGTIDTEEGKDTISGTGGDIGILTLSGTIDTEEGDDTITGTSDLNDGIVNTNSTINTGDDNDNITGTGGEDGIENINTTINTGKGDDTITGTGGNIGIFNIDTGTIDTGKGDDTITGTGGNIGIFNINTGTIDTGKGDDTVDALNGGFAGGGTINLGQGDDLIRGFGEQEVLGGRGIDRGIDTAELGIDFDQVDLDNGVGRSIDITFDSATMAFTDVELFDFNGEKFTLEDLQDLA